MRPKLLHVFPTLAIGGQQTRFVTIANELGQEFQHRLISLDGRHEAVNLLNPAIDVALLHAPTLTQNPVKALRRIIKFLAEIDADILMTYNWGSIDWVIANRVRFHRPHIHLEDGFGPDEANRQKTRRVLTRRLFLQRSIVVVPSEKLQQIALSSWRLRPERVHYVPNGIDASRFDNIPTLGVPFFHRSNGECIIGVFSPLRAEKNLGRLLQALGEISNSRSPSRLVICGDGAERSALMDLATYLKLNDKVIFTGHIPRPEAVMGAFDIFAMSSDTEQMPYAVLEAMAARLPIVATDVGDIRKMVAAENRRFIVPRDDPRRLTTAIMQLCDNPTLRYRIGYANRARVEEVFSIGSMSKALRKLLREVSPKS